uniref:Uncharacterized protein n=1 Tax=Oryza rufipogon TaxID=4529 RepID=A0A0E0PX58_ORYRU
MDKWQHVASTTPHQGPSVGRLHLTTTPESCLRTAPFHHPLASSPDLAGGEPGLAASIQLRNSPQKREGAPERARVPTDNQEDFPPPPAPFALPSGHAPMLVTVPPLRLRCHPPAPLLPGHRATHLAFRAPQRHPGYLAARSRGALGCLSGRPRHRRAAVAAPSCPALPRARASRAAAATPRRRARSRHRVARSGLEGTGSATSPHRPAVSVRPRWGVDLVGFSPPTSR